MYACLHERGRWYQLHAILILLASVSNCVSFFSGLVGFNDVNEVSPHTTSSGTSLKAAELHHYL